MSQSLIEYQCEEEPAQDPAVNQRDNSRSTKKLNVRLTIMQLLRFGVVGGLNTGIDLALFNLFLWLWPTQNTWVLLLYNSLAYAVGGTNSFMINKYWTFRSRQKVSRIEVLRFVITTLVGLSCNDMIIWIINAFIPGLLKNPTLSANVAKVIAILGTMCISYLGMRLWVFVKPASTTEKES